uniref:Serine carboxypeptidase n=1 Tax=Rhipicephalus appendiculatus TaxID=34631 RepID=A0A131Z7G1_RHIAP
MISTLSWTLFVIAAGFQYVGSDTPGANAEGGQQVSEGQPPKLSADSGKLLLTPYIDACNYTTAKKLSKVTYFEKFTKADAYSGYITVNESTGSNLFFLFIEAAVKTDSTPLLLWTQGGPGLSALFGLFLENGPAAFYSSEIILPRMSTLQKHMSVIYVDLPVGAGFSYTNPDTYPKTLEEIVAHVMNFLKQFLELFQEYQGRDIYLAGESYGARYSVAVADHMLQTPEKLNVHLAGVIGGNGFLGPILETADSSDFLYEVSMLTAEGRVNFSTQFKTMMGLLEPAAKNQSIALYLFKMLFSTIFTNTPPTLFQNLTLYEDHASPLHTKRPLHMQLCYLFLSNSKEFKKAIHVGEDAFFQYNHLPLIYSFAFDWFRDIRNMTQRVLDKTRMLVYLGQLDALFPSVKQREHFAKLQWTHAEAYQKAIRTPWKPSSWESHRGFAGYTKKVTNFIETVLLNMSHYGAADRPDEVYELIMEFVNNSTPVQSEAAGALDEKKQ